MVPGDKEQGVALSQPRVSYSIFTSRQRSLIVTVVAIAATFSGFSSNIYFPAIPEIAADLSVTPELSNALLPESLTQYARVPAKSWIRPHPTLLSSFPYLSFHFTSSLHIFTKKETDMGNIAVNLTVTSYLILQGLSPSVWGAVADVHGRRVTYICTFLIYLGACIGLAETKHYYQLVILRCLQSTGSASTIAVGAGVIGDIADRAERGGYMGIYQAGALAPLAIGPILGGVFAETLGWRAIFWFLAIYSGAFLILLIVVLPETLRSLVGNGSISPKGLSKSALSYIQRRQHSDQVITEALSASKKNPIDFLAPLRMIVGMEVTYIIIFLSIYYTGWQMLITVMSTLFKQIYGLSELQIGLTFIANGVGCIIGTLTTGKFLDFDYQRMKKSYNGSRETFPLELARLRTLWLWSGLECASVLVFGWTLDKRVHISVPVICTFVVGWASTSIIGVVTTFMVDCFPKQAASATAALNLVRCLLAAGGSAAVLPIVNAIGVGWTFTLLVGIMLGSLSLVWIQMRYGPKRRQQRELKERDIIQQQIEADSI